MHGIVPAQTVLKPRYTVLMYFVHARARLASNSFLLHALPAAIVFLSMLGLSVIGWRNAHVAFKNEQRTVLRSFADNIESGTRERLVTYEMLLTGAAGLFNSSSRVTPSEWKAFIQNHNLQERYPDVLNIGYASHVQASELDTFTKTVRERALANFVIRPSGQRPYYAPVVYLEPAIPADMIGYDLLADPLRKEAIAYATNHGQSALSSKLDVAENSHGQKIVGFSLFMPVYTDRQANSAVPSDREVRGYAFARLTIQQFFEDLLERTPGSQNYAIKVYDASRDEDHAIFESANFADLGSNVETESTTLSLYGQEWIVDTRTSPDAISESARLRPINTLIAGFLLSLLLAGFVFMLLSSRTRALNHAKRAEVRDAEDELLSLASHQLRTPATSVKQYIGMLREGFAGTLSSQQMSLIDRAYESNERQLHIINELLYVAKIDAKGIVLTPRKIDMKKLLHDIAHELGATAKKRGQKIRVYMPSRKVTVEADEHCIRMSIENLVSNALKYSHESTTITIKLTVHDEEVRIAIRDRGIGIAPEELPLLFQRFSRIPNELSQQISGSGIGLYLSQQLINLHGGSIEVQSVKEKGTTFTVHLPKTYIH